MRQTSTAFLLLILVCSVYGHSSGPPVAENFTLVCEQLTPSPEAHGSAQNGHGGYLLSIEPAMSAGGRGLLYTPNQAYSIKLVGTKHSFKGFLVEARNPTTPPPSTPHLIGRFTGLGHGTQTLNCDPAGVATEATVGHSNADTRSSVQFTWTAPPTNGTVDFYYTVMRERHAHFDQLSASIQGPPPIIDPPGNTVPSSLLPEEYRLHFVTPPGCERAQCSVYVAIDTNEGNDSYLDIYLEGSAQGWVGVGFSHTNNMFSTDAVACNRLGPDMVVLDLFNLASPKRASPTDRIQDVYLFEGNYNNGRLSCKAIKRILPSDQFDIDLNQDLYVLYGKRSSEASTLKIINPHDFDNLPEVTTDAINVVNATGNSSSDGSFEKVRRKLTKTHGVLMLIAWPLLAVTAIFFPVFMKPVLPGGEWFQVHRVLMLASVGVAGVGFILIFVAQIHQPTPGLISLGPSEPVRTTHFVFGVIVMSLHLINPIIGLFRCKLDSKRRWVFNVLHGRVIGLGALLLALTNIGLGIWLLDYSVYVAAFWTIIAWDCLFLLLVTGLVVFYSLLALMSSSEDTRSSVQFTWTAPPTNGTVDFYYTVVHKTRVHFDQLSAAQLGPPSLKGVAPGNVLPPTKSPEDYRLHFRTPDGCERAQCGVYVAIDTNEGNDSYLDIYLEGSAEGWVGVGFGHSQDMFSTDAVACNRLGPDMVVLDLFNLASPKRASPMDRIQDVHLFEGNYNNGRLSCKAIKRILPSDQFDIDLNQGLYVQFGKRSSEASTLKSIDTHDFDPLPEVTASKVNVVNSNSSFNGGSFEEVRRKLTKTHGVLMLIAWPLLAVTAIFFPVFMKPVLPGGEWFQVHRVLMLVSVGVAGAGFILIFVAQIHQPTPGLISLGPSEPVRTTHFVFGVIVMSLHLINPIIGLFRCKPDSKRRWVFNVLHGRVIGLGALLLAIVNIALGAWLLDYGPAFWAVTSWTAVFLVAVTGLLIFYSIAAATPTSEERASRARLAIQALFKRSAYTERLRWSAKGGVTVGERSPLLGEERTAAAKRERWRRWTSFIAFSLTSMTLLLVTVVLMGTLSN